MIEQLPLTVKLAIAGMLVLSVITVVSGVHDLRHEVKLIQAASIMGPYELSENLQRLILRRGIEIACVPLALLLFVFPVFTDDTTLSRILFWGSSGVVFAAHGVIHRLADRLAKEITNKSPVHP